jgi:SulP family sulfate permease
VYAIINVIIALPALYGFSSVIFNHPIFQPHVAALSKLVIFSSFMHQLGFVLFSGLDFAIGTVQVRGPKSEEKGLQISCTFMQLFYYI